MPLICIVYLALICRAQIYTGAYIDIGWVLDYFGCCVELCSRILVEVDHCNPGEGLGRRGRGRGI